jgi:lipopolysaccharide export LptBFGC system permease protein LptF
MQEKNLYVKNCIRGKDIETEKQHLTQNKIEFNRRFGMPIFIPLVALISCFLLLSRNEKKISGFYKYIFFFIGFAILVGSEIAVRYSGTSLNHAAIYYLIPVGLIPFVYLSLIRAFKYENLN